MIRPNDLLDHARSLVPDSEGRPKEVDLRRGISAAYYSVFHHVTEKAAQHLIGSAPEVEQNKIRRTWSHGEISKAAAMIVDRAPTLKAKPSAPLKKEALTGGPLVDLAASDADLVQSLELFNELQTQRHQADYDHGVSFEKVTYVVACVKAELSQRLLDYATPASREAFLTLLTVLRPDFKER